MHLETLQWLSRIIRHNKLNRFSIIKGRQAGNEHIMWAWEWAATHRPRWLLASWQTSCRDTNAFLTKVNSRHRTVMVTDWFHGHPNPHRAGNNFRRQLTGQKRQPAASEATLCASFLHRCGSSLTEPLWCTHLYLQIQWKQEEESHSALTASLIGLSPWRMVQLKGSNHKFESAQHSGFSTARRKYKAWWDTIQGMVRWMPGGTICLQSYSAGTAWLRSLCTGAVYSSWFKMLEWYTVALRCSAHLSPPQVSLKGLPPRTALDGSDTQSDWWGPLAALPGRAGSSSWSAHRCDQAGLPPAPGWLEGRNDNVNNDTTQVTNFLPGKHITHPKSH